MDITPLALKPAVLSLKELAQLCLDHLVHNPDQLAEFMVQTGLSPDNLRRLVGTDGFAHGLLDYVVANEPLLLAIAAEAQLKPESITQTWARLQQHEA
jgi:hypothetical protein